MSKAEQDIEKNVIDQLYWDYRVDSSNINVSFKDGEVTLDGVVPSFTSKTSAEFDAWSVQGVTSVNNNLTVEFPSTYEIPTDGQIKINAKESLTLNADIDSTNIDVSVASGILTLEGSVNAFWKKLKAEDIVSNLIGVVSVINKLTIVPTDNFIDKDIAEDIIKSITRNIFVSVEDVDVTVEEGRVRLSGRVPNWRAYEAAMDAARYTAGVIEINDNLIIESM